MKTAIVVGGGMSGSTAAYLLAKEGWTVRLFEGKSCLGGGCRTFHCGGHPYTIGPRPLYTEYEQVYNFLCQFIRMERFELFVRTYVERDNEFYSYPIHEEDIPLMPDKNEIYKEIEDRPPISEDMNFEEYYIATLGRTLYDKFVNNYSKKMWGITSNTEFTDFAWSLKGVALKTGERNVRKDLIHAHPIDMDGYNKYFDMIYDYVEVHLDKWIDEFDPEKMRIKVEGEWIQGDILVSTTSVDRLMNYAFGKLRYIGRKFIPIVLPVENVIPDPTRYLYYSGNEEFTRVVEYKKLYRYKSPFTLIGIEFPSSENEMYPFPIKSEREKAQKYLTGLPKNVFSLGRMGRYKYDNIGQVIMQGYELLDQLK